MQTDYKKTDADLKSNYGLNIKRGLVVTLLLFNFLIYVFSGLDVSPDKIEPNQISINVENIPVTRQRKRVPPPRKPTIPVPSEDEAIPEDETIEETTLKYTSIFDLTDGVPSFRGIKITPPRPLAWVFPEYPEDEKRRGVQGIIKLSIHIDDRGKVIEVVVLNNTTGSRKCEEAAIAAAYGSRFTPAKEGNKLVNYWLTQPYQFDLKK